MKLGVGRERNPDDFVAGKGIRRDFLRWRNTRNMRFNLLWYKELSEVGIF